MHALPPYGVLTFGVGERQRAAFSIAFKLRAGGRFFLLDENEAVSPNLAIVDADGSIGLQAWQDFRKSHPHMPGVLLSFKALQVDDGVVVTKPLSVDHFLSTLDNLIDSSVLESVVEPAASPRRHPPRVSARPPAAGIGRASQGARPPMRLAPPHTLLGSLQWLIEENLSAWVDAEDRVEALAVFPRRQQVFCNVTMETLEQLCKQRVRFMCRPIGAQVERQLVGGRLTSLDELLWNVSCWGAAGAAPVGVDMVHSYFRLNRWPNFTRIKVNTDFIRMAALLARVEASIPIIVKLLRIPSECVFDFINTGRNLGFLVQFDRRDRALVVPARGTVVENLSIKKPNIVRMLFRKLMRS